MNRVPVHSNRTIENFFHQILVYLYLDFKKRKHVYKQIKVKCFTFVSLLVSASWCSKPRAFPVNSGIPPLISGRENNKLPQIIIQTSKLLLDIIILYNIIYKLNTEHDVNFNYYIQLITQTGCGFLIWRGGGEIRSYLF